MDKLKGVKAIVQINRKGILSLAGLAFFAAFLTACGGGPTGNTGTGSVDPNETAAKVNGKVITMQEVDRAIKQQAQGQEAKMSPLELAGARLQVLDTLIQTEVMFQKAEKEGSVPSEEEITAEINKQKTQSGKSADQSEKYMKDQGMTEALLRDGIKKFLATQKLLEKITGKIEPPKDSEVEAFYNGNKEAFVKKKGVKLGAIVIDPAKSGEGDTTVDEPSAVLKANEIAGKLNNGQDFTALAREYSEDQSRFQGGELGDFAEDDLRQGFGEQTAAGLMSPQIQVGRVVSARSQGKLFILKVQEKNDKDEELTLGSPGVRQQVIEQLGNNRKQLLQASYQAIAMNEAKIENFLAKKVVDNPNELSGARPAGASAPTNTNTNTAAANTNANTANTASNANSAANANAKPAASANANKPASPPANTNKPK